MRIVRVPYGWRATLLVGLFWVVFLAYAYRYSQPVVVAEWAICLLFALNLVTFIYFGHDKSTARRQVYRVPVKVLMALTSAGGSPAAGLAMLIFRHKTKKRAFRIVYFLVIAIHIAMVLGAYKVRAHLPLSVEVPLPFATHLQEFSSAAVDRYTRCTVTCGSGWRTARTIDLEKRSALCAAPTAPIRTECPPSRGLQHAPTPSTPA